MADLIDRQATIDVLSEHKKVLLYIMDKCGVTEEVNKIMDIICNIPTADAIEVVRCKDCRWYKTNYMWNGTEVKICAKEAYEPSRNADDYCSYGERK